MTEIEIKNYPVHNRPPKPPRRRDDRCLAGTPKAKNDCPEVTRSFIASLNERKPSTNTQIIYDHNNHTLLRRMRLRRDSLRIHRRTGYDASLSLSRLPAIQRRSVFVFRHRADGSFQALARLTTLPCLAQSDGSQDPSGAFALNAARR